MLKDKIKLYKDSIISIFSDKMIIVAGGSDSSGCLTKKAFLIKPFEFSAKEICQLPFPVKDGHFVKYINYIYYAGGVVENDDCSSLDIDEGAPILRYSIDDNFWEVFQHNNIKNDPSRYLERNITGIQEKIKLTIDTSSSEISLRNLIYSGVILF